MDFESLVGAHAHVAKQLELRWFYQWESDPPGDGDGVDVDGTPKSTRRGRRRADKPSGKTSGLDSPHGASVGGRLVRRRRHCMPFLRRNVNVRRGRCTSNGEGSPWEKGQSADVALPKQSGQKKSPPEEGIVSSNRKRARGNKEASMTVDLGSGQSTLPSISSLPSFESYAQNPATRRNVLEQVPPELHHDETFVLERMKGAWLEEVAAKGSHRHDNHSTSMAGGESSFLNGSSRKKGKAKTEASVAPLMGSGSTSSASVILPSTAGFQLLREMRDSRRGLAAHDQHQPAYFHYLFMQPNNIPATFVEEIEGRMCPLCDFDGKTSAGLLEHCGRYHGTLMSTNNDGDAGEEREGANFEAALGNEGQLHVVVRGVPIRMETDITPDKFIFVCPRLSAPSGSAVASIERRFEVPSLQRGQRKVTSEQGSTNASSDPPPRQYFNPETNLPIPHQEWMDNTGGNVDDDWLQRMNDELLDEFEDVSDKEKKIMKLWNRFIRRDHIIADREIPDKCMEFVANHRTVLREEGLRMNLLLHLFNLWDNGLVSSTRILTCMAIYDGEQDLDTGS